MLKIKNLRGECQHCGGPLEFHAEHTGTTAECPHCGQPTELLLAMPPEETSPLQKKAIAFTVVALVILVGGLVATNLAWKRAKRLQDRRAVTLAVPTNSTSSVDAFIAQQFRISPVAVERPDGATLVYATGAVTNSSMQQRFGVKVELELFDASGGKVGVASDYLKVLEPAGVWRFRALVSDRNATTAKLTGISEAP